jgi:hypothetical protein
MHRYDRMLFSAMENGGFLKRILWTKSACSFKELSEIGLCNHPTVSQALSLPYLKHGLCLGISISLSSGNNMTLDLSDV